MLRILFKARKKIIFFGIFLVLICIFIPIGTFFYFRLTHEQKILSLVQNRFPQVQVSFDVNGIPSIKAQDPFQAIKVQGYVHAAERLWQMELMARFALGELSEWFGDKALKHDRSKRAEFWKESALEHQSLLPPDEREVCEAYSEGINSFVEDKKYWYGVEFLFLGKAPRKWQCFHSLSVMMAMIDSLAGSAHKEFVQDYFHKKLSPEWRKYLFPWKHPWNVAMFEDASVNQPTTDYSLLKLPKIFSNDKMDSILSRIQTSLKEDFSESIFGSNAWVIRKNGRALLANDPHLAYRVPQLWYASVLEFGAGRWVKGFSIPGIPGIVLGKNQDIAWAFTNTAEDVDDDLKIQTNAALSGSKKRSLSDLKHLIGDALQVSEDVIYGKKGEVLEKFERAKYYNLPVVNRKLNVDEEDVFLARQYVVFVPGMVRLPILKLNLAKDWKGFNLAVDGMMAPSQNILFLDKDNNYGYRTSGVEIQRQTTGLFPQTFSEGKWLGFEGVDRRKRIFCVVQEQGNSKRDQAHCRSGSIINANERVWVDPWNHHWASDDRKHRLTEVMNSSHKDVRPEESFALQLDVVSVFHRDLMQWIYRKIESFKLEKRTPFPAILSRKDWDGSAESCVECFTEGVITERAIRALILILVGDIHGVDFLKEPKFKHRLDRSWILDLIEGRLEIWQLGITESEFLYLVSEVVQKFRKSHFRDYRDWNRWGTQHPFAKQLPWFGKFFEIESQGQKGFIHLVRSERQNEGASLRAVWTFTKGERDLFSVPVGQSGHFYSKHYSDLRKSWLSEIPIFW